MPPIPTQAHRSLGVGDGNNVGQRDATSKGRCAWHLLSLCRNGGTDPGSVRRRLGPDPGSLL